jgi:hypothetical protein
MPPKIVRTPGRWTPAARESSDHADTLIGGKASQVLTFLQTTVCVEPAFELGFGWAVAPRQDNRRQPLAYFAFLSSANRAAIEATIRHPKATEMKKSVAAYGKGLASVERVAIAAAPDPAVNATTAAAEAVSVAGTAADETEASR